MARLAILLIAGMLTGSAVGFLTFASPGSEPVTADLQSGRAADREAVTAPSARVFGSDAAGAERLEAQISELSASRPSYMRDLELDFHVIRLAESDPERAAWLALDHGLPDRIVETAFQLWTAVDADAALAALRRVPMPAQRSIALALTDVLGYELEDLQRIVSSQPSFEILSFQIDALSRLVHRDPQLAFEIGLELDDLTARRLVLQNLGMTWGRLDPEAALAAENRIELPGARANFRMRAMEQWAQLDVDGYLAFVAEHGETYGASFAAAAMGDADAALAVAAGLPDAYRVSLMAAALGVLARRDPAAAVAQVSGLPIGLERDQLLGAVAEAYASTRPEETLTWIRTLEPPSNAARDAALTAIARFDLERAVQIAFEDAGTEFSDPYFGWFVLPLEQGAEPDPAALHRIADTIRAASGRAADRMLPALAATWARTDPAGAVAWAARNGDTGGVFLSQAARELGARDLDQALALANSLPAAQRSAWISEAAAAQAAFDPEAAFRAVERLRGEPGFASAISRVVVPAARRNTIATEQWIMRMPGGTTRDEALALLLTSATINGTIERRWLDGFDSAAARQAALLRVLEPLATASPIEARALVGAYVTDPQLRQQAEATLDASEEVPQMPAGIVPIPR